MLEQAAAGAEPLAGLLPQGFGEFAGGVQGEGEQVEDDEHGGEGVLAVAEVVFEVAAVLPGTLKVSFSIFQRARAQSASSTTLSRSTWRLVTKAPRQVTVPSGRALAISSQLTRRASSPSRTGRSVIQRQRWMRRFAPWPADEVEDGARAAAIEEGISALVFEVARQHDMYNGVGAVDDGLLRAIRAMTNRLEVRTRTTGEWQKAIIQGFDVWRSVCKAGGGRVRVSRAQRTVKVLGTDAAVRSLQP